MDGDISATAGSDRITGAFVDSAGMQADGAMISSGGAITIGANNLYSVQQTTGDGNRCCSLRCGRQRHINS